MIKKIIFIIISLLLIIGSTALNINTITSSKERTVIKNNTEPIKFESTSETLQNSSSGSNMYDENGEKINSFTKKELFIIIITTTITIICLINILITKFGTISILESLSTTKRIIYYSIIIVSISVIASPYIIVNCDKKILNTNETKSREDKSNATIEIRKNKEDKNLKQKSTKDDTSVIQVSNSSTYTLTNSEIFKSSGVTTDKEASIYYGLNSAILNKKGSTINIKDTIILTDEEYSAGLFVRGINSVANIDNVTINTIKNNSNGIVASDGALINVNNLEIKTNGNNSPAVKSICEKSEIILENSNIIANGKNSPLILSSGKLTATNITGASYKSNILTSDSINNITINDSKLTTSLKNSEEGIINLYTTMEKYERILYSNSSLTIENSELTIEKTSPYYKTIPMFYITNTETNINLNNTKLNYGSNILFNITSNDKYGDKDDNGATVVFTSNDQELKGDIILDEKSSINIFLNNTNYKGKINNENLSNKVNIVLDKTTKWELTGDSYISVLTIHNGKISRLKTQIESNGYDIYYDADQNEWLNGETIKLPGGGKLRPLKI